MKKTMRFLSCVLACLMVLSAMPAFASTTATESTPEAFFEDFESFTVEPDLKKGTDSEWINAGFNKGMAQNYNSISGNTTSGFAAKVIEDADLGKAWKTPSGVTMYLGVGFDAPVTSGAVKLAFTLKSDGNEGFPFVHYTPLMGTAYGNTTSKPYMGVVEKGANPVVALSGDTYSGITSSRTTLTAGNVYDIEWIIDIETDKRYLYVDGVKKGEHTNSSAIDAVQGFYFEHNTTGYAMPAVDNILLTTYDASSETMNIVKTIESEGKIKYVFDEVIDDSELTAQDITFKEAGGTNAVTASAIKVVGNTIEISYDASTATAGREYFLTSDKLKSFNGNKKFEQTAIILKNLAEVKETITELDTYDDLKQENYVTTDATTHRMSWIAEADTPDFRKNRIFPLIYTSNDSTSNWGGISRSIYPVNWSKYRDDGHGTVLNPASYLNHRIAHNQSLDNEYGVEVYEFDFATKNTGRADKKFYLFGGEVHSATTTNLGKFSITYSTDGTWQHIKLVYDTVNDTAQLFINDNASTVITNVTQYQSLDWFTNGSHFDTVGDPDVIEEGDTTSTAWAVFDNYESYVLYTPLAMEGVRFVDDGKDILAETGVAAETNQIKVNFSEAISEDTLAGITVTKAGSEVNNVTAATLSADGKTAILTVAGIEGNSNYTINVSEDVATPAGIKATEATYSFSTAEGKFEISDFTVTNADGSAIVVGTTDAENGNSIKITADIVNSNGTTKDVTVIYALYNGTTLVDVDYREITITPFSGDISETFTTKKGVAFDSYKAFMWDGLTTAVPVLTAFEG